MQNRLTRSGTEKSTTNPWNIEIRTNFSPQQLEMMGRVVSAVVAPPETIGARGPAIRAMKGAQSRVKTSLIILEINAIVPR